MPDRFYRERALAGREAELDRGPEPETAEERRARAAEQPTVWRQGGSPGTEGCTIYEGNRFVGSVRRPEDAKFLVAVANLYQERAETYINRRCCGTAVGTSHEGWCLLPVAEAGPPTSGERLDAERRGEVTDEPA